MKRYIVVDDDSINNLICQLNISKFEPTAEIILFTRPEEALDFIRKEESSTYSILLLDINMPTMSGWEFMAEFGSFNSKIRTKYSVFILSSALEDPRDKMKNYSDLFGFFSKPLSQNILEEISKITRPAICAEKQETG